MKLSKISHTYWPMTHHKWLYLLSLLVLVSVIYSCDFDAQNHGKNLYNKYCESCHGADGKGLGRLIPPLLNADYIKENRQRLPCIIRHGVKGDITVNGQQYEGQMVGYPKLSAVEIANLSNYIASTFIEDKKVYSLSEVQDALESCQE